MKLKKSIQDHWKEFLGKPEKKKEKPRRTNETK